VPGPCWWARVQVGSAGDSHETASGWSLDGRPCVWGVNREKDGRFNEGRRKCSEERYFVVRFLSWTKLIQVRPQPTSVATACVWGCTQQTRVTSNPVVRGVLTVYSGYFAVHALYSSLIAVHALYSSYFAVHAVYSTSSAVVAVYADVL